jgi:hypothetical protein
LGGFQRALGFPVPAGRKDACTIGECGEGFNPKINPGFLSGGGQRLHWHIRAGETDIPAIRFTADGDGFRSPF